MKNSMKSNTYSIFFILYILLIYTIYTINIILEKSPNNSIEIKRGDVINWVLIYKLR